MAYVTSDTHFGHYNIIKYSGRPYNNTNEMDSDIISRWNSKVTSQDVVYHCGDFSFGDEERVGEILDQLKFAHLYLLKGNHEKPFCNYIRNNNPKRVTLCSSYMEIYDDKRNLFVLCHYPILEWNQCHRGSYHCYGHVHNKYMHEIVNYRAVDVGVDAQNYYPVSTDEIIKQCEYRTIRGHH